ncbi:methyl-accepting chemotaxis protein [Methylobacterium currus]|uniref:methyl-accepting chemotaxis protein n=1 Tax=Methylobacterium currus TaxID=2051553 RepID=UPI001FD13F9E|nr:HAMP domain-containing methyl-accepting chemotaxis protein [Methylobacterium currus]
MIAVAGLQVVASIDGRETARQVSIDAVAGRDLFTSLSQVRLERGFIRSAFMAEGEAGRRYRAPLLEARTEADRSVAAAASGLRMAAAPALAERGARLDALFAEWQQIRAQAEAELGKALPERDKSLLTRLYAVGDRFLAEIEASAKVVDAAIQSQDASLGVLLNTRATTWLARTETGRLNGIIGTLAVADRTATEGERLQAITADVQSRTAWQVVGRTIEAGGFDRALREAYDRGSAVNFGGRLEAIRREAVTAILAGRKVPVTTAEWDTVTGEGQAAVSAMGLALMDSVVAEAQARSDAATRKVLVYACVVGVTIVLLLCSVVIVQTRIVRGLRELAAAMRDLAAGRADIAVPGLTRRDELGAMAAVVQVFKDNLIRTRALEEETALARASAEDQRRAAMRQIGQDFQNAVGGIVRSVSTAATALQGTATAMTHAAAETVSQAAAVSASAGQTASSVGTVATAAEQLGSSVQEIGRQVAGSNELVRIAVGEAEQAAGGVESLSAIVARIGDVVSLISSIAGQTNLLALNATIEAARAGEAGRGFAVVAAEVKALADQTAKATEEIGRQIAQVQGATGRTVAAIGGIGARIREISAVAASIAAAVDEQGAATQEIVRGIGQAAERTDEVTRTIAGVARVSESTGTAAGQVLDAASDLSRESSHLAEEVSCFMVSLQAA